MRQVLHHMCFHLVLCLLAFSACSMNPNDTSNTAITITDSLEREIVLKALPERIIIAGKANFMINDAVYLFPQAPERIVALTQARQGTQQFISLLDANYEQKARFTLDFSAEEIAASQPDIVLLKSFMQDTLGKGLEQLNIPVAYLNLETPEQYKRDIEVLGQIFGDTARANDIWTYYQSLLDTVQQAVDNVPESDRPTVLVIQHNSSGGQEAFQVPPTAWIQTQLVELAGGSPVWYEAAQGNWAVVNFEQIAAWNPDQIYVLSYFDDPDNVVNNLESDPKWQQLAAVQNGGLYGFPKDFYSWDQPDTRWSLGLMWLAQHIHNTNRVDFDINSAFYHFYSELYGLDTKTINQHIVPLVQGHIISEKPAE